MPGTTTLAQNQLVMLETGLKQLRNSKMKKQPEFKDMYIAIDQHHRDTKLAHLTGKASDVIQQSQQDTKFYYILVRMLNEVSNSGSEVASLQQVYSWYLTNKHVLHSGPRFGKKKKTSSKEPRSILKNCIGRLEKEALGIQLQVQESSKRKTDHDDSHNWKNESQPTVDEEMSSKRPYSSPLPRQKAPSHNKTKGGHQVQNSENLLPKRKVQPLAHMYNPHAGGRQTPDTGGGANQAEVNTPVMLKIKRSDGYGNPSEQLKSQRKWETFQQDLNYGQDELSKLQYIGRGGLPSGMRYSAHEHGLSAEDYTQDVINTYAMVDNYNKHAKGDTLPQNSDELMKQPLEKFYETADNYYPSKLPKYPSFNKEARTKSAPSSGRSNESQSIHDQRTPTHKIQAVMGKENSSPVSMNGDSDIHLNTVVGLIDNVTDELTYHKEKLVPEPQHGFRQPVMPLDPSERPQTAPSGGTIARPTTPDNPAYLPGSSQVDTDHLSGQSSMMSLPASGLSAQGAPVDAIDWRGQVSPNTAPYKYNHTAFHNHSFVKKTSAKNSASGTRSAGSARAGHRPKTAPQPPVERWQTAKESDGNERVNQAASHITTEIPSDTFTNLFSVYHLGGTSRKRSRFRFPMCYDFEMDKDMSTENPSMEYVTFIAPLSGAGSRSTSAARSMRTDTAPTSDSALPNSPLFPGSHPIYEDPFMGNLCHHNDLPGSVVGELDVPDVHDLDDDLDELSDSISACSDPELAKAAIIPSEENIPSPNTGSNGGSPRKTSPEPDTRDTGANDKQETQPEEQADTEAVKDESGKEDEEPLGDFNVKRFCQEVEDLVGADAVTSQQENRVATPETEQQPNTNFQEGLKVGNKHKVVRKEMPVSGIQFSEATMMTLESEKGNHQHPMNISPVTPYPPDKVNPAIKIPTKENPDSVKDVTTPKSPRHRIFTHSFPKSDSTSNVMKNVVLSVDGRGQTKSAKRARSAGSAPTRARSASHMQVMMRQQEMLKRSPSAGMRTAPSIPSQFDQYGARPTKTKVFSSELEAHARRDQSPRHYLEKVTDLRSKPMDMPPAERPSLPSLEVGPHPLSASIKVSRMRASDRLNTVSPNIPPANPNTPVQLEEIERQAMIEFSEGILPEGYNGPNVLSRVTIKFTDSPTKLNEVGRPIPDIVEARDPIEANEAAEKLRQAKAAVDIQRIFRGYVARNSYKFLLGDERSRCENERKAAIQIQRSYRGHMAKTRAIKKRPPNEETLAWAKSYKAELMKRAAERSDKAHTRSRQDARNQAVSENKLSVIGPHVEIYQNFHPKPTGPNKTLLHHAAIVIQRFTRGFLVRLTLQRLKRKAKQHASSWGRFVAQYKELLQRIQDRMGIERPSCPVTFSSLSVYMDMKKRYESVFDKRAFGGELELSELGAYFKEIELYPSPAEVEEAFDAVFRGHSLKKGHGLDRHEVLEITHQIYPPSGSGIVNTRRSTWLNPIVNGEEGQKLIGTERVEDTDFKTVWNLVAGSRKERKIKQSAQDNQDKEEEWQKKHGRRKTVTQNPGGLQVITEESDPVGSKREASAENHVSNNE